VSQPLPHHGEYRLLPIELIRPGRYQPRKHFDPESLQALADSIRAHGVIQPVSVRPDPRTPGGYELVAGERRWRAAQLAGCDTLPAIIRETEDQEVAIQAIIENLQREDLDPIAEAAGVLRLVDEFDLSHQEVAEHLGVSRSSVSHRLRLLRLPEAIQQGVKEGVIEIGHARLLVALKGDSQHEMYTRIIKRHLTVRQLESALRADEKQSGDPGTSEDLTRDTTVKHLEERLGQHLGAPVTIEYTKEGDGTLRVKFFSLDEFDGLLEKLGWPKET
jgi:ParB family chromosome partitioning protein